MGGRLNGTPVAPGSGSFSSGYRGTVVLSKDRERFLKRVRGVREELDDLRAKMLAGPMKATG